MDKESFLSNILKECAASARRAAQISGLRVIVTDAKDRFGHPLPTHVALVSQEPDQRDLALFWNVYRELVGAYEERVGEIRDETTPHEQEEEDEW